MKDQSGVTLIEILSVMTISSLLILIVYSMFFSATKVYQTSLESTNLRNEAVLILTQFDKVMMNVDTIEINGEMDDNGYFHSFHAINSGYQLDESSGGYKETTYSRDQIEINESGFSINGNNIHSENYFLEGSSFSLKNSALLLDLVILDVKNGDKFQVNKLYDVQSE